MSLKRSDFRDCKPSVFDFIKAVLDDQKIDDKFISSRLKRSTIPFVYQGLYLTAQNCKNITEP